MTEEQILTIFKGVKEITPEVTQNIIMLLTQYRVIDMIANCAEIGTFLGIIAYTTLKFLKMVNEYENN